MCIHKPCDTVLQNLVYISLGFEQVVSHVDSSLRLRIYKEKLATLKKQLQQVIDGTHPDLIRKLKKMEQQYKERLRMAEVAKQLEVGDQTSKDECFTKTHAREFTHDERV